MKKRILSGMRPTGPLHIGHLVGALKNWVKLQDEYECFFMIADWHALMSEYEDPSLIMKYSAEIALDWLSVGIDSSKSTIFLQSDVKEHLDVYMVLSTITPLGWLERCPTYKEQLRENKTRDLTTYAFLGYPVLQAADILLYKAHAVPVGEDQKAHLELTREIARKFNSAYRQTLVEPQELLTDTPRLLGLDGRKMSKSFNNFIALSDSADTVRKKISTMFTDPKRIKLSDKGHPDKCNVHSYYAIFSKENMDERIKACREAKVGCTECKKHLADVLIEYLAPIQTRREEFKKMDVRDIIAQGAKKAQRVAAQTLDDMKKAMQFSF
ncbi:MAG: tryptophan--tRNA ligase [Candidatus Omnitrophota bacterium]